MRKPLKHNFITLGLPIIVILLCIIVFLILIFHAYTGWSMPFSYSYGEYSFSVNAHSQVVDLSDLVFSRPDEDTLRVIALKNQDDIMPFICEGAYNWDGIKPTTCGIGNQTDRSIEIYTYVQSVGDDSVADKEIKYTFTKSEQGYYVSTRSIRQRCDPGRGWSLSLYPGNCS